MERQLSHHATDCFPSCLKGLVPSQISDLWPSWVHSRGEFEAEYGAKLWQGLEASIEIPGQDISYLLIDMSQCAFLAVSARLRVPWLWHLWEHFWHSASALPWASSLHIWDLPDAIITWAYSLNEICSACRRIWLVQFLCRALTNTLL